MSYLPNTSHIAADRLAALADEAPSAAELAHLAACAECARERAAYRSLTDLARSESTRIGSPITSWESMAPVLVADGVIDRGRGLQLRARQVRRPWLQAASAVLLIGGGMVAGRFTARPSGAAPAGGATVAANAPSAAPGQSAASGSNAATSNISNVSNPAVDSVPRFRSVAEARAAQLQSQLLYQSATSFLAQRDTSNRAPESPAGIRTRLAALDRTRQVMGEALHDSPYDPVINGYYMTTLGQREATIQQLNAAMPVSMRATSY